MESSPTSSAQLYSLSNFLQRLQPMNPAAPVTRTVFPLRLTFLSSIGVP